MKRISRRTMKQQQRDDVKESHQMAPASPSCAAAAADDDGAPRQSTVGRGVDNSAFEDTAAAQDTTPFEDTLGIVRRDARVWLRRDNWGRSPKSKVVYSIGIFYCDTEQCKQDEERPAAMTSPRRPRRTRLPPEVGAAEGAPPEAPLPDILQHSAVPPPYPGRRLPPPAHPPPPPPRPFRGRPPPSEADEPKHCCGVMVTQTVSIRWFIVMIAFVGLCCAIVGTVLGALKATGREHLTVSLLMIGVGIVLITVSGIAWRLTSHDAPSCRAMLGLHTSEQEPNRRFVPRVPPYGRPHHPYAAMMYPEFQYRPPPPSYQASMQEYRLRLLLLDRQSSTAAPAAAALSPVSPPPTYRSHTTLHSRTPLTLTECEYSRPPSYRSRASSAGVLRPSTETLCSLNTNATTPPPPATTASHNHNHRRNPSLSLSFLSHESLFLDSSHSRPQQQQHFTSPSGESVTAAGLSDDSPPSPRWTSSTSSAPPWKLDSNAVTIVQTTNSSQVLSSRDAAVVLSVPPDHRRGPPATGEVRILAHV